MMRSLYSAVSGLRSHQTAMDVIGNNIANVNTSGFKSSRVVFQDIFSQTVGSATAPGESGGTNPRQVGLGVEIAKISSSVSEGSTQATDYTLDLSIQGEGYFAIECVDGVYYTRNGAFDIDAEGNLVTANGDFVLGVMGSGSALAGGDEVSASDLEKIQIDEEYSQYQIDINGILTAIDEDGDRVEVGRLALGYFTNPAGLTKEGQNYLRQSPNSGEAEYYFANDMKVGRTQANTLEMSNVDLANEMTSMIVMQRGFQANSRVITVSDTLLEELINLKR